MSTSYYNQLIASLSRVEQSIPSNLQPEEQTALSQAFSRVLSLIFEQIEAIYEYNSRHRTM